MQLFEITVDSRPKPVTLLVVASDEAEARALAGAKGTVQAVDADHGPFDVLGGSRVIGHVELAAAEPPPH